MDRNKIEIIRRKQGGKMLLIDGYEIRNITDYEINSGPGFDGVVISILDADISIHDENTD